MKKVFAALAASAVAVSMLAFAGCGNDGVISGKYEDKTPEQMEEIVDNIDGDKLFSDEITGLGLKANLSAGFDLANNGDASGSLSLDFKLSQKDDKLAGSGTASLKFSSTDKTEATPVVYSGDVKGTAYIDDSYVYASATGKILDTELTDENAKIKLNLTTLGGLLGGFGGFGGFSLYEAEDAFDVASLLALAKEYGVSVTVDDRNGVKFKLSATEDTVWSVVAAVADGEIPEAQLTAIKEKVTFNTFKFDAYFAIDANGAFSGASVDVDLKVTVDSSLINGDGNNGTAYVKGFVELYTHKDTVTVPDSVKNDKGYVDGTGLILGLIGGLL